MEKVNNPEEEELYALLDKALQDESISVSEELIQKTLRRAEEEVISFPRKEYKARMNYRKILPYCGMAAAAVLVLVLGGNAISGTKENTPQVTAEYINGLKDFAGGDDKTYSSNNETKGAAPVIAAEAADNACDGMYSSNGKPRVGSTGSAYEDGFNGAKNADTPTSGKQGELFWLGRQGTYTLSAEVTECFTNMGYTLYDVEVPVWTNAENTEIDRNERILAKLQEKGAELFASEESLHIVSRDESGLAICQEKQPDAVLLVETNAGDFWIVFGEELRILR